MGRNRNGSDIYDPVPIIIATAQCIKIARLQKGLDQAHLAERIGLSQSGYSRMEAGSRPITISDFCLIAGGLNLMPSDLMTIVENAAGLPK